MNGFRILAIDHIVLRCRDIAAMEAFYCEFLGCTVVKRNAGLGLVHLRAGNAMIDLVPAAAAGPESSATTNMDHFCLRIEPFDPPAAIAHLQACGVEAGELRTRFGAEGDGLSFNIRDPEGNRVELKGPAGRAQ